MLLHALGQQVGTGLIAGLVAGRESFACSACTGLVTLDQQADHVGCGRHAVIFLDRAQFREGLVGARRREAQGTDALGDIVHRQCQLVVLGLEHGVQRLEHRPLHVPVEVVGLQVQGIGVCQQMGQPLGDLFTILLADTDINLHYDLQACYEKSVQYMPKQAPLKLSLPIVGIGCAYGLAVAPAMLA